MSVSLCISCPNGRFEEVPFAGQIAASTSWRELGNELGLYWVPLFADWVPVESENLEAIIQELETLRAAVQERGGDWAGEEQTLDALLAALRNIRGSTGWRASFG